MEETYVHGGDIYSQKVKMDYSANINPLGMPEGVKQALLSCVEKETVCSVYPDSACRELRSALSAFYGLTTDWFICGNGAADLIFALTAALKPSRVLLPAPSFLEYRQAIEAVGGRTDTFYLKKEEDFALSVPDFIDVLKKAEGERKPYDLLFLCNPNNPTGIPVKREEVCALAEECEKTGTFLVVDECFCEFLEQESSYSVLSDLERFPHVLVLRAFTKIYAMAGLRLGYAICKNTSLLKEMNSLRQSWPVSGLAQQAGIAALKETEYVKKTRKLIKEAREKLKKGLENLGFLVYPSQANYLFFEDRNETRAETETSARGWLYEALLEKGVLIRSCSNYPGLTKAYYRICVKTEEENEQFLKVVEQVLQEKRVHQAKPIMIQGTMSNAGKSLLAAALCRIFVQDGYRTAPFKSQNMALNSYITEDGKEMGRAQVVQAEAAKILPASDMNPVLLKPTTDVGSQVIVNGVSIGNMKAKDYFAFKKKLWPEIMAAYERLSKKFEAIVIEGAGSPAEINLKSDDIVNMGLAKQTDAPVLLVGDIDRGGVFAQLYGTVSLLEPEERARVKGLIINKFRGDVSILEPGLKQLEELCQIPVLGVVPYVNVDIEDEDSLSEKLEEKKNPALIDLAVIRFPRISNFTDMDVFSRIPGVSVRYVSKVSELKAPDLIILPGTKNTISDLLWMRQNGLEAAVLKLADRQVPVWGICGGFQMMGEVLSDENGEESETGRTVQGMGLLPLATQFESEKVRVQTEGAFGEMDGIFSEISGKRLRGYEIHMGRTVIHRENGAMDTARVVPWRAEPEICRPLCFLLENGEKQAKKDGWNRGNLYGSYVHGVFDEEGIAETMIQALAEKKGISLEELTLSDYRSYKERQYDLLADTVRNSLDMDAIYEIMGLEKKRGENSGE